jgi:hypothetical protein
LCPSAIQDRGKSQPDNILSVPVLQANLTFGAVDDLLDELERSRAKSFVIEVNEPPTLGALAGARLVGLLARTRDLEVEVEIRVAEAVRLDFFEEHIAGVLLVASGARVLRADGSDITAEIRRRLQARALSANGVLGANIQYLLLAVDNPGSSLTSLHEYPPARDVDLQTFPRSLVHLLETLFPFLQSRSGWPEMVARYVFEIWQNASDHGTTTLSGVPLDGIRAIFISFTPLDQISSLGDPVVTSYVAALRDHWNVRPGLLEISIADSGIGIPARLSGRREIYEAVDSEQMVFLQRAMEADASSKKRRGSGLGFPKVLRVADRTRGLLLFRTGHLTAYKHYLPSHEPWPSNRIYKGGARTHGLSRGTQVSLLLPVEVKA